MEATTRRYSDVRITDVDIFEVRVPSEDSPTPTAAKWMRLSTNFLVVKVETDAGVTGYSFGGPELDQLPAVQRALVGADLFDHRSHWRAGLLQWGGVEHAVWDAIGRLAGQPVHRLLGGSMSQLRCYLTVLWPGADDQSDATFEDQAAFAVRLKDAGFKGMKYRAWRPDPMDDVVATAAIRAAVGPDFGLMLDRTGSNPTWVWDYATALAVARGLEDQGVLWLEEPFHRDDFMSPARLAREVDIPITGGEAYNGLAPFQECLRHQSFDVLQPDAINCGGILAATRVATLANAAGVGCFLHGYCGLKMAGWLQASAAIGADWQEVAIVVAPMLPDEMWAPANVLVNTKSAFTFNEGMIEVPSGPGLGLDLDLDALQRYRVTPVGD